VKGNYQVIDGKGRRAEQALTAFCKANGQILLPLVELIEQARLTVSTVLEQVSQQTIETILELSAEQVAGPRTPGRARGEIRWHGSQAGRVSLEERQISVRRPRLRQKGKRRGGEVEIPAYQALANHPAMGARMFETLLRGVSTRQYRDVLPRMAETVGVSKSTVSQRAIEASTAQLEELLGRRWEETELLVIYIDGMQFGTHHVISAVGVDFQGHKQVLGLQLEATNVPCPASDPRQSTYGSLVRDQETDGSELDLTTFQGALNSCQVISCRLPLTSFPPSKGSLVNFEALGESPLGKPKSPSVPHKLFAQGSGLGKGVVSQEVHYGFTAMADWGCRVALPIYDRFGAYAEFLSDLILKQSEVKALLAKVIS
jgi:hypothetical protein